MTTHPEADPGARDQQPAREAMFPLADLKPSLEAILLVADEPIPPTMLAQVLELPKETIAIALAELAKRYDDEGRGFDLREVAGG